ncbi:hypothetical protein CDAR_396161 [Caerostris darwini]|uniref:Uncharacterized protein n=1 Tax=Caerostris darwini TaxID=1538125 RepID=A0AAV4WN18_9ARAC|nr:hypothetical protein CDAR_396161 [Caerostris darwini]
MNEQVLTFFCKCMRTPEDSPTSYLPIRSPGEKKGVASFWQSIGLAQSGECSQNVNFDLLHYWLSLYPSHYLPVQQQKLAFFYPPNGAVPIHHLDGSCESSFCCTKNTLHGAAPPPRPPEFAHLPALGFRLGFEPNKRARVRELHTSARVSSLRLFIRRATRAKASSNPPFKRMSLTRKEVYLERLCQDALGDFRASVVASIDKNQHGSVSLVHEGHRRFQNEEGLVHKK